jgi:hypothetical protein
MAMDKLSGFWLNSQLPVDVGAQHVGKVKIDLIIDSRFYGFTELYAPTGTILQLRSFKHDSVFMRLIPSCQSE